ncbi:LysR family transcriptional regulator [Bradyrhizobium lablabi]|uniref:LysR family transcriptional regulator n=1 Tax=Bradyrhizobium lablabi TaxID=722472 RepID=UPI001BA5D8FF|nr:LysR family transcriptional regulator [Bradyrhizobium lablabi]MBR0695015.1 LysR family transcriptional regulator [Bradyrhizobium lablabi]
MAGHFSRDLTIRQLRALSAVQAAGSITSAANRLNLTQPAVTLQLRNLQALAGMPLIQRTGDGIALTDAGAHVLALVERIEAALLDCEQSLDLIAGRSGGRVSMGAVSTAKYFVPYAIAAFSRRFPKIEVLLRIGNRQEIRDALRGYDLDIAVMGQPPADVDVEMRPLGRHPHFIVAAAEHRLARRRHLAPIELADETFITRERGSGTRMLMEQFFLKNGLTPKIGMEMDSNETIKQAVMAGLGVAFISQHTVFHELEDSRLVVLNVKGLPVVRQWHAIRRADKILLPPAQAMLDFLGKDGWRYLPNTR